MIIFKAMVSGNRDHGFFLSQDASLEITQVSNN